MDFNKLVENVLEDKGLPYTVDESGDVSWLRKGGNLKGAPETVEGNFYCTDNKLTSLEGAPEAVGGEFYCDGNLLKSLKGIPKAEVYYLPKPFTEKDALKEIQKREMFKNLEPDVQDTWKGIIDEL